MPHARRRQRCFARTHHRHCRVCRAINPRPVDWVIIVSLGAAALFMFEGYNQAMNVDHFEIHLTNGQPDTAEVGGADLTVDSVKLTTGPELSFEDFIAGRYDAPEVTVRTEVAAGEHRIVIMQKGGECVVALDTKE